MQRILKKGDRGPLVRELQSILHGLGQTLKLDGSFGAATDTAVRAVQKQLGLPADGIVGPATWNRLHGRPPKGAGNPMGTKRADHKPQPVATPKAPGAKPAPAPGGTVALPADPALTTRRVSYKGFAGRGYVVQDYDRYLGHEVKLLGGKVVRLADPKHPILNECAQFVQLFGIPRTKTWRAGPKVCTLKAGEIEAGTIVATLRDGVYHSDYSGRSHVGIYIKHDDYDAYVAGKLPDAALTIMDQYNGAAIDKRLKRYDVDANERGRKAKKTWVDAKGKVQKKRVKWGADGEEYYVLMTED